MRTLAVIGVGLIGGSFALALRKAGFDGTILGVSSPRSIESALRIGAITCSATLEEAATQADVLYLSQPIAHILTTIQSLSTLPMRPGCLITDAGSTKSQVVRTAREHLPNVHFLGGHPMAGKEQRGVEHADADLFRERPYVLTPDPQASFMPSLFEPEFRRWLDFIGAEVVSMHAEHHDRTVAYSSHLPQLLSTALAATLANVENQEIRQVFGSGLLDMTRLALSAPDVWSSILTTNKPAVREALHTFSTLLTRVAALLEQDTLGELFESGASFARDIRDTVTRGVRRGTEN